MGIDERELVEILEDLGNRIHRLRILYDQYFLGIERMEPLVPRKEVVRILATLQQEPIRNTALRFRHLTLVQRWNMYCSLWLKTQRDIERGTYARHIERARRKGIQLPKELDRKRRSEEEADITPPDGFPLGAAVGEAELPRDGTNPRGEAAAGRPRASQRIPGMTEAELQALHRRYLEARQQSQQGPSDVKFDTFVASLERQVPAILKSHQCKQVTFDIQLREGKIVVKATPQR